MDNLFWLFPSAIRIDSMPNLDFIRDIEYFEGPLLSEYRDSDNHSYIYYWLDCDQANFTSRWMVIKVSSDKIESYVGFKTDLRSLILNNIENFIYVLDVHSTGKTLAIHKIMKLDLSDNYLPNEGCMHMEMDNHE